MVIYLYIGVCPVNRLRFVPACELAAVEAKIQKSFLDNGSTDTTITAAESSERCVFHVNLETGDRISPVEGEKGHAGLVDLQVVLVLCGCLNYCLVIM